MEHVFVSLPLSSNVLPKRRYVMNDTLVASARAVTLLALASLLLTGCPKHPMPGPMNSAGNPSATGSVMNPGASSTNAAGGGQRDVGPASAMMAGAKGTNGTTLPRLPAPTEFVESSALRDVHFDFDKYDVRSSDKTALDANARWLKGHARALVLIEGHCDERGTNEYNLALGERRARAARDYLTSAGVSDSRITIVSYGEERPLCTERAEACWAQNRRAHFLVKE
jgi:peptidoglycan-associated lipoprotein